MYKKIVCLLVIVCTLFSSSLVFADESVTTESKPTVIERQLYRQDIYTGTRKLTEIDGQYYMTLEDFKGINGFNVTCDIYDNMLYVFISRANHKYFDYYFDYDNFEYYNKAKVAGVTYTEDVPLPIYISKDDYPGITKLQHTWLIPLSYIVEMTGGTFTVDTEKAVIDYGYKPSIDAREKGRQ